MASPSRPTSLKYQYQGEQQQQKATTTNLVCNYCGLMVESAASLRVHIHFNHENTGRWTSGAPSPTTTAMRITSPNEGAASVSPTDSENNNQPFNKRQKTPNNSPTEDKQQQQQNPVAAAADSSDNKPPSPLHQICSTTAFDDATSRAYNVQQPTYYGHHHPFLAPPPTYEAGYGLLSNNYDSLQHQQQQQQLMSQQQSRQQQHEYKQPVPSHRYHPYQTINNHNPPSPQQHHHITNTSSSATAALSDTIINSTTVRMQQHQMANEGEHQMVSPKQCDKCGFVCDSVSVLADHCATQHGTTGEPSDTDSLGFTLSGPGNQQGSAHSYIKEETTSDILDLDSHKVVYPHHEVIGSETTALPPMHSLHQSIQRHPLMWHEPQYMPQQQPLKPQYFPSMKAPYVTPVLGPTKSDYGPVGVKSEYMSQTMLPPSDVKMYADSSNNQVSTSQSDFPTTTTPQDSDAFRTQFEPASSSLPSNPSTKSASWKSNEARRPKTYNCTACNKWFTSSGHLKRHYNTTLHKNAVKSSGQPDPATLPISAHHHPARDSIKNNHHIGASSEPPPPSVIPPPVSSGMDGSDGEFGSAPQYSSGGDFRGGLLGQVTPTESNSSVYQPQQFCPNPPNGVAGPSALHASQPRGLLTHMANITPLASHQEVLQPIPTTNITTMDTIIQPSTSQVIINTIMEPASPYIIKQRDTPPTVPSPHTIQSHQVDQPVNYPIIIGDHGTVDNREAYESLADYHQQTPAANYVIETPVTRFTSHIIGDTVPPFSPDMPDHVPVRSLTPRMGAIAPPVSPSSPSVSTSARQGKAKKKKKSPSSSQTLPFKCVECDKIFNRACYLTQHNKTFHSGEKPFRCHKCGKRFPCGQSHEEHVTKHTGEKPHKCDQCPKQFNHKTDLRRHLCLHTGYKPHTCEKCGKGFIRKDHLMKHKEVHEKKTAEKEALLSKAKKINNKKVNQAAEITTIVPSHPKETPPNDNVLHIEEIGKVENVKTELFDSQQH